MGQITREISIVAPVYNEEGGICLFYERVTSVLEHEKLDYEIILVDDGSRDNSFLEIPPRMVIVAIKN